MHPARPGLLLPARLDPEGLTGPTRAQAQRGTVRRTSRGFYLPATVTNDDVDQRIVEASVLLPPGCALTGWAALRWRGGRWFSGLSASGAQLPVPLLVGTRDIRPRPGIRVVAESVDPALVTEIDGVRVHDPRAAVSFEMRYAHQRWLPAAVVPLDMAAYSDLVTIDEVDQFLTPGQNSWTGVPLARQAIGYAEENSWSPQESAMRMTIVWNGGRKAPLANRPVFDLNGRHLATPDLIDPRNGVVAEYDGRDHLERERRNADIVREELLRDHGLEPVTMTAADRRDPVPFIYRMIAAHRRANARPPSARLWTLTPPPGWIATHTVAARRALPPSDRARLLRYRAG